MRDFFKVKKDKNGDEYVGFELKGNINSDISDASGYVCAWSGYAVVVNAEHYSKSKEDSSFSML